MKISAYRLLIAATALVLSVPALAQPGSGGIGSASQGLRTTGAARGIEAVPLEQAIPGRWRIEFRIRNISDDPDATGRWRTVTAEMWLSGSYVNGQIREGDFPGDFNCTIDEHGRCIDGRLRFREDLHDWEDFNFVLDRMGDRAEGWAVFTDRETGAFREYELRMRKR